MNQHYEYVRAVNDPSSFIKANLDSKPSGLRHLLREMQSRKRVSGIPRDKKLVKEVSPSAYDRYVRRKKGESIGSLERESQQDKELKKILRLND